MATTDPTTITLPTDRAKKTRKKPSRDPSRVPKPRVLSARMQAMAALEFAERKRPPLAAKLARLETARANLEKLDGEITALKADVVRITTGEPIVTERRSTDAE